ncbi:hypothetical protein DCS_07872 [Drechmeria coniospora]|uniref:ATP phosphoribosyltransferase n=1 Tax=Drechmeria coniospora TaxID=98403 RepID=A0A151GFN0_DRECN|nr:hypothetical protein DCS_07872 [Drechmeria coniospora]KYK55907.1 hypothetical protein DCS_07872 [Drechmeria coniospora]ODA81505.1 hypothetical protein RJ55_00004 [Drechmeria coniospora]
MDLRNSLGNRLLFAVPKKGRLNQAALNLLEGADIQFRRQHRLDIALVKNHNIALVFLPAADIPIFVGQGRVDLGITGWDQVKEYNAAVHYSGSTPKSSDIKASGCKKLMELGFGDCRLQVQVPEKVGKEDDKYNAAQTSDDLVGKTIGTSFPNLATEFFCKIESEKTSSNVLRENMTTKIIELSGSVEAACALGVADGIVDLVESGETMRAAGLKAIGTVIDSTAVLVQSLTTSEQKLISMIASRIKGVIAAQQYVLCQYNIERTKLPKATSITPGKSAPTVTSLTKEGWVAVSAMVPKKEIATVMDELVFLGATDIIVLDIHNTRTQEQ